ncbi:MAG: cytochrome c [Verrucomicrobia bacterium]|nr:cytochrome c [Verrucomicrobiota bacterium]MDA1067422.1 cytochrome c [Verrucomicrobiota bacterium]
MRFFLICLLLPVFLDGETYHLRDDKPLYTEFLDKDFPFLEATVDLRGIAPAGNKDNLVPRAVILPLEDDIYVCFDTELLRVAAIWQGDFVTLDGLAILSYEVPLRKMGGGQKKLPKPIGKMIASTGLYPGWFKKGEERFEDPRSRWIDENELGRGPLPPEYGEWIGVEDLGDSALLHYSLFGGEVSEHFRVENVGNEFVVVRTLLLEGVKETVSLVVDDKGTKSDGPSLTESSGEGVSKELMMVSYPVKQKDEGYPRFAPFDFSTSKFTKHWPDSITTEMEPGKAQGSYAVDHLRIPYPNPWERRVRPYSIDFYPNGDAIVVTYDGDVYRLAGLGSHDDAVGWTKIAAGFHEPNCIKLRGDDIFVFSRLGITKLEDLNGDGEIDFYRMFCNRFTQSGDTRDFPMSLVLRQDGSWIINKGGQQETAYSPHSGRVLKVSADGKQIDLWAYGFRNGFLNSIPERDDLIVASDQQGNWVPTTPFHIVREGSFLGFQPGSPAKETPIQPPALWLPHRVAQSGIDPLWGSDSRLGALYKSILYIEFKRPSLIKIFIPEEGEIIQAAGVAMGLDFEVPLLKGAISPTDGMAYMVGFQIWDCFAPRLEGICRLRVLKSTDEHPTQAKVFKEGVLLRFADELDPQVALDPASFNVSSWEYIRKPDYGSAHYKADGTTGADVRYVHSVLLTADKKSVFIAIDNMTTTMQLEVQHLLTGEWSSVYFTIHELSGVSLVDEGFPSTNFQQLFASAPTPRDVSTKKAVVSEARGLEVATLYGCIGCHSLDGSTEGKSGPTWAGLWRSKRTLTDGRKVEAMEEYLRESILDPVAKMVAGFDGAEAGMPPYQGILSDEDVESLVIYIRSLHRL